MTAIILDGKKIAAELRENIRVEVAELVAAGHRPPRIDVLRVGEDPASEVYVRMKEKAALELGIDGRQVHLSADVDPDVVRKAITERNDAPGVDAILLQLPLPAQLSETALIRLIAPEKDVDGFHPLNIGCLVRGEETVVACTPAGVMEMIRRSGVDPKGRKALVVGRSNIVGKPVAHLLLQQHATVTIAHSRTANLAAEVSAADILVAAVGVPEMIRGSWIKPGAVVVDVGVNRLADGKLVGDVEFAAAAERAGWITPVPGGVGPLTITFLLRNALDLYKRQLARR